MSFKQKNQFTNRSDYWNTPSMIYKKIMELGYVDYNPAGSFIDPFNNDVDKYRDVKVFINPPFSLLSKDEMYNTIKGLIDNDNEVLLLMPSRTDTQYFHRFLEFSPDIYLFKGRLAFNDKGSAPFPTLLLRFAKDTKRVYKTLDRNFKELS